MQPITGQMQALQVTTDLQPITGQMQALQVTRDLQVPVVK